MTFVHSCGAQPLRLFHSCTGQVSKTRSWKRWRPGPRSLPLAKLSRHCKYNPEETFWYPMIRMSSPMLLDRLWMIEIFSISCGKRGQAYTRTFHSWTRIASQLDNIYRQSSTK